MLIGSRLLPAYLIEGGIKMYSVTDEEMYISTRCSGKKCGKNVRRAAEKAFDNKRRSFRREKVSLCNILLIEELALSNF